MRILTQPQVAALLPMADCIPLMEAALAALARGQVVLPLRSVVPLPDGRGAFAMMPAVSNALPAFGAKVITVFPGNQARGLDSHQGAVLLFDASDGRPVAMVDASSITAIRTAAVSAVATRLLARDGAATLALLGSGTQARAHLEAMALVRPIAHVRIWSRTAEHAKAFAAWARQAFHTDAIACASVAETVRGAGIVCTVTASRQPVLAGDWLEPGMHINAVGASQPDARELDSDAVARARIFPDRMESLVNESADFLVPRQEGRLAPDHLVAEIGDVVIGKARGRDTHDEITLFKSLGLAVEDVAAACHVLQRAEREGVGIDVAFGGGRSQQISSA